MAVAISEKERVKHVNSLLPGLKLERPIFTTALPIPGHERVKQSSCNKRSQKKHLACLETGEIILTHPNVKKYIQSV